MLLIGLLHITRDKFRQRQHNIVIGLSSWYTRSSLPYDYSRADTKSAAEKSDPAGYDD